MFATATGILMALFLNNGGGLLNIMHKETLILNKKALGIMPKSMLKLDNMEGRDPKPIKQQVIFNIMIKY